LSEFYADLAKAYQQEIAALAEAGCKHIQLDDTNLAYLCSQEMRDAATERGEDVNELPRQYVKLINEALRMKPADMTASVHLCRGNFRSRHFASGGYEPVAEILFGELEVDNFLLEWDDERSGGLEPLRFLPKDGKKRVVLGLVSTKTGKLEDKSKIIERIREAAKYAPLEQLGMGPQCGYVHDILSICLELRLTLCLPYDYSFASTHHGNELTEEEQWKKVQFCNEIVEEVWGKQA
jgi:5-methyltetrahydropteroyltriglutamate--homocysteine methyltransferase